MPNKIIYTALSILIALTQIELRAFHFFGEGLHLNN